MTYFNAEEQELLAGYMPEATRLGLIKKVVKDTAGMEDDIREIAEGAVDKLARMDDLDFVHTSFLHAL